MPSLPPPKTLVLLFDGTGKSFEKEHKNTNVIRLSQALENDDEDRQLLYYQPGYGTYVSPAGFLASTFRQTSKLVDQLIACYLSNHVIRGYHFLMQNYRRGDRICLFGFSRGAYTARVLAGMLHKVGLLPKSNEEHLPFAWKHYKDSSESGRNQAEKFKEAFSRDVDIAFVGVWDTVASIGLFGLHLGYTRWNPSILVFRHAVALDERRTKYQPNPCGVQGIPLEKPSQRDRLTVTTESNAAGRQNRYPKKRFDPPPSNATILPVASSSTQPNVRFDAPAIQVQAPPTGGDDTNIQQAAPATGGAVVPSRKINHKEVWFAGCHSDVGGGSSSDLANNSFAWMVKEAILENAGLIFRPNAFSQNPAVFGVMEPHLEEEAPQVPPAVGDDTPAADPTERLQGVILELAEIFGFTEVPDAEEDDRADMLYAKWTEFQEARREPARQVTSVPVYPDMTELKNKRIVQDACAGLNDRLRQMLPWWVLEVFPSWEKRVRYDGYTTSGPRWNWGRGRVIPLDRVLVHSSVLVRHIVLGDYLPRASWKKDIHFVD